MDKIILGILMLDRRTVYEIRSIIQKSFKAMCSDSLGSIQAAIKKLLSQQMITCREYVEKSVNKKQYSITDEGRKMFLDWVNTPAAISNPKNMELGKLLFMGLVPAERRLILVDEGIALLEQELTELLDLKASLSMLSEEKQRMAEHWAGDPEYLAGIQNATKTSSILDSANDIGDFQMLALQYGIDGTRFQLEWYRDLENKLKTENRTEETL